jgi:hypothetical protein
VVERLPSKYEALSSKSSFAKKKKERKKEKRRDRLIWFMVSEDSVPALLASVLWGLW